MKENFFSSMFSEGGKISHKRWISVTIAGILGWVIVFACLKAANATERQAIIVATMFFVLAMSGVATVPQIIALMRGGTPPADKPTDLPAAADGPGGSTNPPDPNGLPKNP